MRNQIDASRLDLTETIVNIRRVVRMSVSEPGRMMVLRSAMGSLVLCRKGCFSAGPYGGLSGFPKNKESEHDIFDTGHGSVSLSSSKIGRASCRERV